MSSDSDERNELRRAMRARRRQVCSSERQHVAQALAANVNRSLLLRPGMRVALYRAYGHEADASELLALARRRGCKVYLPVVTDLRRYRMEFVAYPSDAPLRLNAFGILEPKHTVPIAVRLLDVVFLPLVAVDTSGWRLGSGAGFYDRRLHHLHATRRWRRPRLIGVAYEFQRVPALAPHRWDVPLDGVVTECALHRSGIGRNPTQATLIKP